MRLKTFFFPIMLVISISIFAGYIWPEISDLKTANEVTLTKNEELRGVDLKKTAIEQIGKQIADTGSEKIVEDYLPKSKTEDRIINGVSYLATSSNVSLANLALKGSAGTTASPAQNTGASIGMAGVLNPVANANAAVAEQPSAMSVTGMPVSPLNASQAPTTSISSMSANISISGSYDNIRMFLDGLHNMPILNTVKSVVITNKPAEKKDGVDVPSDNSLSAAVAVDFGYLETVKIDNQKVNAFKSEVNNETIDTVDILKKYTSQKNQSLEDSNSSKGRVNPFISN